MTLTTITKMILLMDAVRGPPLGVHFTPLDDFDVQFEDGEFITSLTPTLHSGAGLVPHINTNMREYKRESSDLIAQKIPTALGW